MFRMVCSPLVLALVGLGAFLAVLEVARPGYFLYDDNATWFSAAYAHDFRTLARTGRLAEVNFYQYGGEPFLQQGQTGVLYPPVYLAGALARGITGSPRGTIEWLAALHLMLAAAGFYAWLRRGGVDAARAALGGLVWALNPFVFLLGASWIPAIYTAGWLPWLFWALDGVLDGSSEVDFWRDGVLAARGRAGARPSKESASVSPAPGLRGLPRRGLPAIALAVFLALFFWQGYVQWVAYAIVFLGFYLVVRLIFLRPAAPLRALGYLVGAAVLFAALGLPLILPMLHGMAESDLRARPLPLEFALDFAITIDQFLRAQIGQFSKLAFGTSGLLVCPAAFLVPWMIVRAARGGDAVRRRLLVLLFLAALALLFSTRAHLLLSLMPFFGHFRWPFKVFILVDFFLVAALAWTAMPDAPAHESTMRRYVTCAVLALVLLAEAGFSLARHDAERYSPFSLPAGPAALAPGMDPARGRTVNDGSSLTPDQMPRYFTHCYGTYFEVPTLGGYNPLVGRATLDFGAGIDYPNIVREDITPELRAQYESRAVRYWMISPESKYAQQIEALGGFNLLARDADRLVYEDTRTQPMAFVTSAPEAALPIQYAGNSMLIQLSGAGGIVAVSVGPTDGWRFSVDGGPWGMADYHDDRLYIPVREKSRVLEVSYFDPRLRLGIFIFLIIIILGGIAIAALKPVVRSFPTRN
jgi:hypothetical protein